MTSMTWERSPGSAGILPSLRAPCHAGRDACAPGALPRYSTVQRCQRLTVKLSRVWIRRHENKKHEPSLRFVAHAVFDIRRREHDLIRTQVTLIVANVEPACAFNHEVDLVCARVR